MYGPTLKVTTPTDLEIVLTRAFNAPRKLVWEALTQPELVRRWMFVPPGWTWAECAMDVRVGGTFRWAWNGPEGTVALTISGVHKEVLPPARIVHTERMEMAAGNACRSDGGDVAPWELLATMELSEQGGKTHMHMTLRFPTKAARDGALASGMEQGMSAGYDNLDRFLAESAKRS